MIPGRKDHPKAVRQSGYALEFADEELRMNREVVLAAVTQNGLALRFAAMELRSDRDIVLAAVRQVPWYGRTAGQESFMRHSRVGSVGLSPGLLVVLLSCYFPQFVSSGTVGYAIELSRRNSFIFGVRTAPSYSKPNWKRWGAPPPTFSSGFSGRRGAV
jgi:hypothetical protein